MRTKFIGRYHFFRFLMADQAAEELRLIRQRDLAMTAIANEFAANEAADETEKEAKKTNRETKEAEVLRVFKAGRRAIKKAKREAKGKTEKEQAVADLAFGEVKWVKIFQFEDVMQAKASLWDVMEDPADWVTPKAGARGANKKRSYHGAVDAGKYMITSADTKGTAPVYLWRDEENEWKPDGLTGGTSLADEDDVGGIDMEALKADVSLLLAPTGKSWAEVAAMQNAALWMKNSTLRAGKMKDIVLKHGDGTLPSDKLGAAQWFLDNIV